MGGFLSFISRFAPVALIATCIPLGLPAPASASCSKTWLGGFSGNWEDWQNWSQCDTTPNNQEAPDGDDDVVIDGAAVTLGSGTTINSFTIGSTTTSSLTYNSANNNPNMQAAGGITIGSHGSVTLDGTTGANHGAATLDARSSTLTNNGTITTQGGSAFGAPQLAGNVTNNSTINVNASANFTESTAPTSILDNKGTIAIANGATLTAAGQSCGDTGNQVTNDTGGQINATGTGALVATNYTQGDGTTSGTTPVVQNCGFLHYTGTGASGVLAVRGFTLTGSSHPGQSLTIRADNFNTNANATSGFTNGGTITLDCSGTGCAGGSGGAPTFNVGANTLSNSGTVTITSAASGGGGIRGNLTNTGTINVNGNATMTPSGGTATLFNQGMIAIANGVTLSSGGSSCGDTSATVTDDTGGQINATGTGTLSATGYTQGAGTTSGVAPVTIPCGSLTYTGSGASSVLAVGGFHLSGSTHPGQSLTIRADNFNTNADAASGLTNGGTITLDCPGTGCAGGSGGAPSINVFSNTLTNSGTITVTPAASGQGGFTGNLTNAGTLQFNGSARMQGGGALTQTSGTAAVASGMTFDVSGAANSVFNESGGLLTGSGTIAGNVSNTGGKVQPGSSPGTLTVTGNYTQGSGATLDVPLNGVGAGQYSVLGIGGNATLAGTLAVQPSGSYAASATSGDTAVGFLTYGGSRTGSFATTTVTPPLSGSKSFTPSYVDVSKRVDAVVTGDGIAPTVTFVHAGTSNQLKRTFIVSYHASDAGSGVASYDVRYRRAAWNSKLGPPIVWKTKTTATSPTFTGALGYEYCFSVRARDVAGNVSPWSAVRCAAIPLDDRALSASSGWKKISGRAFFNGTALQAAATGRTLTRKGALAGRAALVVDKGKKYGSIAVLYNGKVVKKISLAATTTLSQIVITLPKITRKTTIVIKTTSGKVVRIDGLLLARV